MKNGKVMLNYVKDDEIKVYNSMYDIVTVKETNDSLFFTCINDKDEEKLISNYLDNEKKSDSNNNHSIYKNLKPFSVFVLIESRENSQFYSIIIPENENGNDFYKSIITDVLSPPPESIL